MNRINFRSLGIGFLVSAVITAGFAVVVQGQPAVRGLTINDLFSSEAQLAKHKEEMSSLIEEKDKLVKQEAQLKQTQEKLEKENKALTDEVAALKRNNSNTTNNNNDANIENEGETVQSEPQVDGPFEITEGLAASEIANMLEEAGYIESALEFNELIEEWGLSEYIITDTYELNSDMSIHDIASIITHGAYYY